MLGLLEGRINVDRDRLDIRSLIPQWMSRNVEFRMFCRFQVCHDKAAPSIG